jgi:hypothetical protein
MAAVAQRRIAAAEEYNEIQLFSLRPPADDEQALEYVRKKRDIVLARMSSTSTIVEDALV